MIVDSPPPRRSLAIYAIAVICAYAILGALSALGSGWMVDLYVVMWYVLGGPAVLFTLIVDPHYNSFGASLSTWGLAVIPLTLLPVYFIASATTRQGRIGAGALQALLFAVGLGVYYVLTELMMRE
ncbi:MAG: hypothetical protein IT332_11970 [Ardenticatenales bacterium]|nr:hypothetical protein [Ardenticatenales bacterium]